MLGVLIGVGAVILLMAVGNGSAQRVNSLITSLGTNTLTIRSNGQSSGSQAITLAVSKELTKAGLGHVKTVVPESTTSLTVSSTTTSEEDVSIIGTTPGYFDVSAVTVASGASFTTADVTGATRSPSSGRRSRPTCTRRAPRSASRSTSTGRRSRSSASSRRRARPDSPIPNLEVVAPVTRVQRSYTGFGALSEVLAAGEDLGRRHGCPG